MPRSKEHWREVCVQGRPAQLERTSPLQLFVLQKGNNHDDMEGKGFYAFIEISGQPAHAVTCGL